MTLASRRPGPALELTRVGGLKTGLPYSAADRLADGEVSGKSRADDGDGRGCLRVAFDGFGETDFIDVRHFTGDCARTQETLGQDVLLEAVPEIIAKKIRCRGFRIRPRDVFDMAAAVEAGRCREAKAALAALPDDVAQTSERLAEPSPDYVEAIVSQLMIRPGFKCLVPQACSVTQDLQSGHWQNRIPDSAEHSA